MRLKISIPEDMNYNDVFNDILDEYTVSRKLLRVKTTQFGSLFELCYDVTLKDMSTSKEMIDNLRCKNGNMNIILSVKESNETALF